jgi:lysophospholipase L1-like esterase
VVGRSATVLVALVLAIVASSTQPAYRTVGRETALNHVAIVGDSYTTGSSEGGNGASNWTTLAWQKLASHGRQIDADVAAEGRAGYVVRGYDGHVFGDLAPRAVRPDDELVVFYGSRNDQGSDPVALAGMTSGAFDQVRRVAPAARLLVIGPPWPTADVPPAVLQIRDVLRMTAGIAGATFVDPIAEGWFVGRPELIGRDGVHPTDAGHAFMADRIAPLIGAQLPQPT